MPSLERRLTEIVERSAGDEPMTGLIRVSVRGAVVFERAWGFRQRAERLPCEADTRFATASGSKTFTAVAICRLVDRGLLSLDESLVDRVERDLPGIDRNVTVRHLLTHTSGVADYFDEEEMDDFEALWRERPASTVRTPGDVYDLFRGRGMKLAPGERFSYSNGGFILLGLLIEDVTGESFARHVESEVFRTAGMVDSGYFAMDALPARTALGYVGKGEAARTNIYSVPAVGQPDGGAFTTALDMERFWDALLGGTLLKADTADELIRTHVRAPQESAGAGYGFGIWTEDLGGGETLRYASGSDPGVGFNSGFLRDGSVRVTVMRNSDGPCQSVFLKLAKEVAAT